MILKSGISGDLEIVESRIFTNYDGLCQAHRIDKNIQGPVSDTVLSRSGPKSHAFNKESVGAVKNQDRLSKTINSIVRLARITVSGETNPT
ncbi:MAG: hypothetical protein ACR2IS_14030 [Nitrososphaeraceae archaeon]